MYKTKLKKGFRLLDKKKPGWEKKIELNSLRMQHECCCLLGQIYGEFDIGIAALGLRFPEELGFDLVGEHDSYKCLTQEVKQLIQEKLEKA